MQDVWERIITPNILRVAAGGIGGACFRQQRDRTPAPRSSAFEFVLLMSERGLGGHPVANLSFACLFASARLADDSARSRAFQVRTLRFCS
jgi:hypothetical protein